MTNPDATVSYRPHPMPGRGHELVIAACSQEAIDVLLGSHTIRVSADDLQSIEHAFTFVHQLQHAGLDVRFTPGA